MELSPDMAASLREIDRVMQIECVPDDLKAKGWEYRDMPGRVTPEGWDKLFGIIGAGEYQILVMSEGANAGGRWKRGQFCISPKGLQNMRDYSEAQTAAR